MTSKSSDRLQGVYYRPKGFSGVSEDATILPLLTESMSIETKKKKQANSRNSVGTLAIASQNQLRMEFCP